MRRFKGLHKVPLRLKGLWYYSCELLLTYRGSPLFLYDLSCHSDQTLNNETKNVSQYRHIAGDRNYEAHMSNILNKSCKHIKLVAL